MKALVDNKSTSVQLYVVEQRSAWGTITPIKQKDEDQLQREEQRMSPDFHFGQPDHRARKEAEQRRSPELTFGSRMSRTNFEDVEHRLRETHALAAEIRNKCQTDDDKTG